MLVLSRKERQQLVIGNVVVTILHASHGRVSVGIEAPREIEIVRGELLERDQEQEAA